MIPPDAKHKYVVQKADAKRRGIEFLLTFEEWIGWWLTDGRWERRGRGRGKLVMARYGDAGAYSLDNIRPATHAENMGDIPVEKKSEIGSRSYRLRKERGSYDILAQRGAQHPRARAIITPDGRFESGWLAADHYGLTKEGIYHRVKAGWPGWFWEGNG